MFQSETTPFKILDPLLVTILKTSLKLSAGLGEPIPINSVIQSACWEGNQEFTEWIHDYYCNNFVVLHALHYVGS